MYVTLTPLSAMEDFLCDLEEAFDSDPDMVLAYLKALEIDQKLVREIKEEFEIEHEKSMKRCSD